MATVSNLEKRLEVLEAEMASLRQALAANGGLDKADPQWWLATSGRFRDDPVFAEIARLGREWRESFRPGRKNKAKPRKLKTKVHVGR